MYLSLNLSIGSFGCERRNKERLDPLRVDPKSWVEFGFERRHGHFRSQLESFAIPFPFIADFYFLQGVGLDKQLTRAPGFGRAHVNTTFYAIKQKSQLQGAGKPRRKGEIGDEGSFEILLVEVEGTPIRAMDVSIMSPNKHMI